MSKERNDQAKKIADVQIAFGAGLAAMIFSAQFLPITPSWPIALILLVVGLGAASWASRQWRKLLRN